MSFFTKGKCPFNDASIKTLSSFSLRASVLTLGQVANNSATLSDGSRTANIKPGTPEGLTLLGSKPR